MVVVWFGEFGGAKDMSRVAGMGTYVSSTGNSEKRDSGYGKELRCETSSAKEFKESHCTF